MKIKFLLPLSVALIGLSFSRVVTAAPGDEHWSSQFGHAGTTNPVLAIATIQEKVYAAGYSGGAQLTNATIDLWNGIKWSTLGDFSGSSVAIYDMEFAGNTLWVGGSFTNVSGVAARGLAKWDGTNWSSVTFNGLVLDLAVDGSSLYVAGSFTNLGGVLATNVARWDGANWHALGDGLGDSGFSYVGALYIHGTSLYAGGAFTNSGPNALPYMAMWNGSSWSAVGGGVNGEVTDLTGNNTGLFVTGSFTQAGPVVANRVAKWNGATWSALGTGLNGAGNSVAFLNNVLCVAGTFTAAGGSAATNFATWNGAAWSSSGGNLSANGTRVVSTGTNIYLGGSFAIAGNGIKNGIASWDGVQWRALGVAGEISGVSSSVRALASDGTNILAGGSFTYAGQTNASRIGRYDGTNWYPYGSGLSANVTSIGVVGTNVYVGGDFTPIKLLRWTGVNWSSMGSGSISSISTLATRGADLYVAGNFSLATPSGTNASWLARWDGSNFHGVMAYDENTFWAYYINGVGFSAMAIDGTNIYLSGYFNVTPCDPTWTQCTTSSNVVRFDGTYGRGMGTGLNTNATAISVVGTNAYFAGPFLTNAGGVAVKGIAKWNGSAWFDVGGGVIGSGSINALATIGTNLYAGGSFTNIGGVAANRIAKWNGSVWSALGSGTAFSATAGPVLALKAVGSNLYVGGTFRTAGGKPSQFIALWNEAVDFGPMRMLNVSRLPGGDVGFKLAGLPLSGPYSIEASTNLNQWDVIHTGTPAETNFVDAAASENPKRFYRLKNP